MPAVLLLKTDQIQITLWGAYRNEFKVYLKYCETSGSNLQSHNIQFNDEVIIYKENSKETIMKP